jgi:hypothetical protein
MVGALNTTRRMSAELRPLHETNNRLCYYGLLFGCFSLSDPAVARDCTS